ncbi:LPS export ABC transporter periplasmic protein LptC [Abyssibacter sp.]|uniref:LPS export ABC transporter periplasmic protein LptC n=1 Tax=Abyssibacter sp. TaxID=2320200 RepID=UPI000C56537C|nr:LPS export ABC transporter periplasmic protein LptC [Abyssibacter sp.]MBB86640.1 LPS export ABC transporter periplasmic protein LptC [Xanthomonadales bacterium]MCK5859996.1 LPS export ABC transporter periplasmic protein LptC [Abyssibacter sp.]
MSERKSRLRMSALTAPGIPLLAVAIMGAVGIALLQGDSSPPENIAAPPPDARSYLADMRLRRFGDDGQLEYRATADRATYFADGSLALSTVDVDYLGGRQSVWTLSAPSGRVPPSQDRIELTGAVNVHGRDEAGVPVDFNTEQLLVELESETLRSEAPVELRSPDKHVEAIGLVADFQGTQVELLNRVRAEIDE